MIATIGPRLIDPKAKMTEILDLFRFSEEKERISVILKRRVTVINSEAFTTNTDRTTNRRRSILSTRGGRIGGRAGPPTSSSAGELTSRFTSRMRSTSESNLLNFMEGEGEADENENRENGDEQESDKLKQGEGDETLQSKSGDSTGTPEFQRRPSVMGTGMKKSGSIYKRASKTFEDVDLRPGSSDVMDEFANRSGYGDDFRLSANSRDDFSRPISLRGISSLQPFSSFIESKAQSDQDSLTTFEIEDKSQPTQRQSGRLESETSVTPTSVQPFKQDQSSPATPSPVKQQSPTNPVATTTKSPAVVAPPAVSANNANKQIPPPKEGCGCIIA